MLDFSVNSILMGQLEKGNEKAFSFLVENYNQRLCVYANSLVNDPVKAQDIVQNVFIKTWEKRETLRHNLSIKGFLYRAVHNEFIDQYRSAKSLMALEKLYMDTLVKFEMEPEQQGTEEIMERVMFAINDLPPKCQQIFLMSKKEGLDNIEIAEYLEISRKTVENQITKAFTILREKLGKKYKTVLMVIFGVNTKNVV
ncbi:RNA polymerase sigma factor [Arenibacter algicola]|nr:RNA polymerase sigma-70 factor [Arenibacter algicola]MBD3661074.1 RNA polymerase sigma-70 factor [Arenibacter algicola]GBF21908.1 RNA polymerase sigma factor CnrH [Arenibacter sp. NBRC 103722]|tara:strand:- start:83 stop:676 length:594 start_codon:yes stop_codon:yes gene_type:complete